MAERTLAEVATATGQSLAVVRKHAQRGKLHTEHRGTTLVVTDEAFDAYVATDGLRDAADAVEASGRVREAGHHIARLPSRILEAILAGTPKEKKKVGDSVAFREATAGIPAPATPLVEPDDDNPHGAAPIGHQWIDSPRWKRISEDTWALGATARYTWNGMFWEGHGTVEGRQLGDGISPAHPFSHLRPIQPSKAVDKK